MTIENTQMKEIFIKYYQSSRFELELRLPDKPSFHHFRFEHFAERNRFRRLRDVVRDRKILVNAIVAKCPKNVYFSPLKWLDPINVRKGEDSDVRDYMLSSPLYFDIDRKLLPKQTLNETMNNTEKLINYIEDAAGRKPDWIVFSGSGGFHVYYWEWDDIPKQYDSAQKRIETFIENRKHMLKTLRNKKILVDEVVTADPWRILRVPGTLHGDTCLIAKLFDKLSDFSIGETRLNLTRANLEFT